MASAPAEPCLDLLIDRCRAHAPPETEKEGKGVEDRAGHARQWVKAVIGDQLLGDRLLCDRAPY